MSSLESLEKQLVSLREEHKDDIHSLEMKALLEKRRLVLGYRVRSVIEAVTVTEDHHPSLSLPLLFPD